MVGARINERDFKLNFVWENLKVLGLVIWPEDEP